MNGVTGRCLHWYHCIDCSVVWLCPSSPLLPVLPLLLAGLPPPAGAVRRSYRLDGSSGPGRRLHLAGQLHPAGQRHLHLLRQEPPRRARLAHVSHRAHRLTKRWASVTDPAVAENYTGNDKSAELSGSRRPRTQQTLAYQETFCGNIFLCPEKFNDSFIFGFVSKKKIWKVSCCCFPGFPVWDSDWDHGFLLSWTTYQHLDLKAIFVIFVHGNIIIDYLLVCSAQHPLLWCCDSPGLHRPAVCCRHTLSHWTDDLSKENNQDIHIPHRGRRGVSRIILIIIIVVVVVVVVVLLAVVLPLTAVVDFPTWIITDLSIELISWILWRHRGGLMVDAVESELVMMIMIYY